MRTETFSVLSICVGILGVFLDVSVLSIIEFIYYSTLYVGRFTHGMPAVSRFGTICGITIVFLRLNQSTVNIVKNIEIEI